MLTAIFLVMFSGVTEGCNTDTESDEMADTNTETGMGTEAETATETETGIETETATEDSIPTAQSLANNASKQNYINWLSKVAVERTLGSAGWQSVQDLCSAEFRKFGYTVELQTFSKGTNVIGRLEGTSLPETHVVVAAHYDHIEGCIGADDNGTGVAGLLETARVLSLKSHDKSLIVACFDQEENGLLGSTAFVEDSVANNENIDLAFIYEMIGYINDSPNSQLLPPGFDQLFPDMVLAIEANENRADFAAILANEAAGDAAVQMSNFAQKDGLTAYPIVVPNALQQLDALSDLRRSDHAPFWDAGFLAINITDTANMRYAAYHCREGEDVIENLNHDFAYLILRSTIFAAATALNK